MKINKILSIASEFDPTNITHQKTIFEMCKSIKESNITLPLYQRDLSWTLQKCVDLFNYQLFGKAPISPISMNQMRSKDVVVPQVSFLNRELIDDVNIEGGHLSVVDGQQRLSTNYKAYIDSEDFRNIVLDMARASFRLIKGSPSKMQIPVGVLYNEKEQVLTEYIKNKNRSNFETIYPILVQVRSKFKQYSYTLNIAENLTEDEQIEWFEVLNNAGSRVSALETAFSKLKIHNLDIYTEYTHPFSELLEEYGFSDFFKPHTTNVSYPISMLNPAYEIIVKNGEHNINYAPIPSDTKESILTNLKVDDLRQIFTKTLESTRKALEFIAENNLEAKIHRIDYILYLSGFYCFNPEVSSDAEGKLIEWVNDTSFTNMSNSERRDYFNKLINLS